MTPHEILQGLKNYLLQRKFIISGGAEQTDGFSAFSHNYEYSSLRISARSDEQGIIVTICYKDKCLNTKSTALILRNFGNCFAVTDKNGAWMRISATLKSQTELENIAKMIEDAYSSAVLVE